MSGNGLDEMLRYELLCSTVFLRSTNDHHIYSNHLKSFFLTTSFNHLFSEISSRLFDLGAAVATPVQASSTRKLAYTEV